MLVLFETPAGYALFKVLDEGKLKHVDRLAREFETPAKASALVQLKAFRQFEDTTEALAATTALVESKMSKELKKFLSSAIVKKGLEEQLGVIDVKLANAIKEKLGIACVADDTVHELFRGIRSQLSNLLNDVSEADLKAMVLGLGHSLSRYKLKFSADKVDTMIVQAINLLDDLDKQINTYAMRVREWYGWHFPELTKIVTDNMEYARCVIKMGDRVNALTLDFSDILQQDVEAQLKESAVMSMGTDVSEVDILNIRRLCEDVLALTQNRANLFEYLQKRMMAVAPNLTVMVGELVGARLIAHAGSLLNLSKQPASTVQILGAEKALFRALKTKHQTPKYGLLYHASLVGQAGPKNKGKISRILAAKAALSIRVDALGESSEPSVGIEGLAKVQARLRQLEGGAAVVNVSAAANRVRAQAYAPPAAAGSAGYNAAGDVALETATPVKRKHEDVDGSAKKEKSHKKEKSSKKEKKAKSEKKAKKARTESSSEDSD